MNCPKCNSRNLGVAETLSDEPFVSYRKRKCKDCSNTFYTIETVDMGTEAKEKLSEWSKQRVHKTRTGEDVRKPAEPPKGVSSLF